ncbi:hypothetical protein [Mycobacterium scrofulaceum]|uniref:Uncharacterized protein n=1 Tax=Mycobacterium scrofulaceum TaxID=1783 RepID=A0A1X0KKI5_MYCSC|nr:hypothetical protein [Mycobacterium scrofulaceum]ORB75736.1 hypothetical protein BST44_02035 [Mycobacterium scrofulaceum]
MVANAVLSAVLALGCSVGTPVSPDPNPFGGLGCDCRNSPSAGGEVQKHEISRGISDGLSGALPAPMH